MRRAALAPILLTLLLLAGCNSTSATAPSTSDKASVSSDTATPLNALPLAPVPLPERTEAPCSPETADADFSLAKIDLPDNASNPVIFGDSHPLIWYTDKNGKWGACDWDGTVLLPCQYDSTALFCEDGVAAVEKDGLWGYVNLKGEELLSCKFACAALYHDGVLLAGDDSETYIVCDLDGNVTGTLAANINTTSTCGGLIQFCDDATGLYGYLNADGSVAIPAAYSTVYPFGNGLAAAQDPTTGKDGFLDFSGQWAVAPRYDVVISGYTDGYAAVGMVGTDSAHALCGLIDAVGNPASDMDYTDISPFSDGWAAYCRDSSRGYLDKSNVEHDLSSLLKDEGIPASFGDGYAVYTAESGLCGLLDSSLNIAVPAQFSSCSRVIGGQALVQRTDGTFCVLSLKNDSRS